MKSIVDRRQRHVPAGRDRFSVKRFGGDMAIGPLKQDLGQGHPLSCRAQSGIPEQFRYVGRHLILHVASLRSPPAVRRQWFAASGTSEQPVETGPARARTPACMVLRGNSCCNFEALEPIAILSGTLTHAMFVY